MTDLRPRLAAAWTFVTLNYLYCDVVSLMDPKLLRGYLAGQIGGMTIDGNLLLAGSVLMEVPIGMVLVSRLAGHRMNRIANLVAGTLMTLVQAATLFLGTPTAYYAFFSVVEIACTALVVRTAWRWRAPESLAVPV